MSNENENAPSTGRLDPTMFRDLNMSEVRPKPVRDDILTIGSEVVYMPTESDSLSFKAQCEVKLESKDEPYARIKLKAGPEWTPIDFSWVENPSLVWIKNPMPQYSSKPTPEQKAADLAKVLYIKHEGDSTPFMIPVGLGQWVFSTNPKLLRIRCDSDTIYQCAVFPK